MQRSLAPSLLETVQSRAMPSSALPDGKVIGISLMSISHRFPVCNICHGGRIAQYRNLSIISSIDIALQKTYCSCVIALRTRMKTFPVNGSWVMLDGSINVPTTLTQRPASKDTRKMACRAFNVCPLSTSRWNLHGWIYYLKLYSITGSVLSVTRPYKVQAGD